MSTIRDPKARKYKTGLSLVRVQFWLSYLRPDYADQSLKEIVLRERNGLWLIAEERTLEVNIISD